MEERFRTTKAFAPALIRLMVGTVFLSEGIQKFLFPEIRGVGRFIRIGIPFPEFFGYIVPTLEIVCVILVLLGLFSAYAAIPLIIIMVTAIVSTKIPLFINEGLWEMAHASRTDWSMLLGSIFLLIIGSGNYSIDSFLERNDRCPWLFSAS